MPADQFARPPDENARDDSVNDAGASNARASNARASNARASNDSATMASRALAQFKADAQARGVRPQAATGEKFSKQVSRALSGIDGESPRRQRRDDPTSLDAAIGGLVTESGWEFAMATASLFGRWAQIVGPDLAAHTSPEQLADGELVVVADSTAWATQLRLLARDLVRRLNAELGDGTVRRVNVRGPGVASGRRGEWRVRGGRGPRDTYG